MHFGVSQLRELQLADATGLSYDTGRWCREDRPGENAEQPVAHG